jgi:hypothetical protein
MKTKSVIIIAILIALALVMAIVLRGSNQAMQNPTIRSVSDVQTAAVGTYASSLTQTLAAKPTATSTPAATITPTAIRITATPTPACYHLRWIKDETIPDFSRMNPGETFTKTWRVINNGICTWKAGFQFAFYGGDPMGGSNYTLTQPVDPGQQMDLSIPMTAPSGTGIVISTWRMSDITGWFFGDALTVKIDLGGETPTP